jgi:Zn-dependent membrane protease YugP
MHYGFGYYWTPWDLLLIPGILLGLYAHFKLTSTYNKFLEVPAQTGLTGAEAARQILDSAGLTGMPIEVTEGHLSDHFDPMKKALFLSEENFAGRSISAVSVAAHEAGHALQQQSAYAMFNLRMMLVPATKFASIAWIGIFILAIFLRGPYYGKLIGVAIGIFSVMTLFQVITLPVEYDASRRAKVQLLNLGIVTNAESDGVNKVLNAAAMTYVAGMLTSILELLKLIMIANSGRNRD